MRVILLRDVAKIGRRFEVREVPSGHAQNFLIPQKLAIAATPDALRKLEVEMKKKTIMTDRHDSDFASSLQVLTESGIELSLPANEQGHLFKGVHASDIVKHLALKGLRIEEKEIVLPHPLKEIGEHAVILKSGQKTGEIIVRITRA
jgi:large subunit ribosomal protein L9